MFITYSLKPTAAAFTSPPVSASVHICYSNVTGANKAWRKANNILAKDMKCAAPSIYLPHAPLLHSLLISQAGW